MHLFLAGVSIGRCAEDPEWQPEECKSNICGIGSTLINCALGNHEKKFYVGTLETISSVFIDIVSMLVRSWCYSN